MHGKEMVMCIQTFEAITDDNGNIQFADTVRLPAHQVYVVVPEQTVIQGIVPESMTCQVPQCALSSGSHCR